MLTRARILELIPHQGTMCLLDEVTAWSECDNHLSHALASRRRTIRCDATARLNGLCGIEYGLQAAALHGALRAGGPQPAGYLAALRSVEILDERLDDPSLGALEVTARVGTAVTSAA